MKRLNRLFLFRATAVLAAGACAAGPPLKFAVGRFQPDKDKNDAIYRPRADCLSVRLDRSVELRTVDSWERLAKSLANGESDVALKGALGLRTGQSPGGRMASMCLNTESERCSYGIP